MKGFETGMPVLEKRPEKLEEDAEVKNEEVLLKESFGDLESVAQDLERIFAENPELIKEAKKDASILKYKENLESGKLSRGNSVFTGPWGLFWANKILEDATAPENVKLAAEKILKIRKTKRTKSQKQEFRKYVKKIAEGKEVKRLKILTRLEEKKEAKESNQRERSEEFALMRSGIMYRLKKDLKNIDERKDFSAEELKGRKIVSYDQELQNLFVLDNNGEKKEINLGDLVGDYEWGIKYAPDFSVPLKIWRKMRKILVFYETRSDIEKILNKELMENYQLCLPATALDLELIDKKFEKDPAISGILAERMMVSWLRRIQYDNPELSFKVEKSNALEDVVLKYDFKLSTIKRQGIALEPDGQTRKEFVLNKRKLGIQFTTAGQPAYLENKSKQIIDAIKKLPDYKSRLRKPVDDIVLVSIFELSKFADLYKKWVTDGKPSGGPEQYLTREQKLDIFKQVTGGLLNLSEEELKKLVI